MSASPSNADQDTESHPSQSRAESANLSERELIISTLAVAIELRDELNQNRFGEADLRRYDKLHKEAHQVLEANKDILEEAKDVARRMDSVNEAWKEDAEEIRALREDANQYAKGVDECRELLAECRKSTDRYLQHADAYGEKVDAYSERVDSLHERAQQALLERKAIVADIKETGQRLKALEAEMDAGGEAFRQWAQEAGKTLDELNKRSDERMKACDERMKACDERMKACDERMKVSDERRKRRKEKEKAFLQSLFAEARRKGRAYELLYQAESARVLKSKKQPFRPTPPKRKQRGLRYMSPEELRRAREARRRRKKSQAAKTYLFLAILRRLLQALSQLLKKKAVNRSRALEVELAPEPCRPPKNAM